MGKIRGSIYHYTAGDERDSFWKQHEGVYESQNISFVHQGKGEKRDDLGLSVIQSSRLFYLLDNIEQYDRLDCYTFVLFLFGEKESHFKLGKMKYTPDVIINKGDIVGFGYNSGDSFDPSHFTLYLGEGRYLSKLGTGRGKICVMTREELEKVYAIKDIGVFCLNESKSL